MTQRVVLALFLLAGLAIRLPHLADPPLAFHPTRQYRSALLARGYFLDRIGGLTPARRQAAEAAAAQQGPIEPPIVEHVAAFTYRLTGQEHLSLARLFSVLVWVAGGAAVAWTAAQLFSGSAAVLAALGLCLFMPYGIGASQAFQPDPLMTALTIAAVATAIRHDERGDWRSLALLVLAVAAALFAKPMAGFFVFPVVAALMTRRRGWRGTIAAAGWLSLASLPTVAWYWLAAPSAGEGRMYPQLLRTPGFWFGWLQMIDTVAWLPLAVAGIAGVLVARGARAKTVLIALWGGYALFGLVFTYHIQSHNYYSLPLIPVVALSVAALVDRVDRIVIGASARKAAGWAAVAAGIVGIAASVQAAGVFRPAPELNVAATDYERIGRLVGDSHHVLALDGAYGFPLEYHGFISVQNWPLAGDRSLAQLGGKTLPSIEEELAAQDGEFFVATSPSEMQLQPDLQRALESRYPVVDRGGTPERWRYLVFDLRHPRDLTVTPTKISFFALVDGTAASETHVALAAPVDVSWRVGAPSDLFGVQPDRGRGPATLVLVPVPTLHETDRTLQVPVFLGDATIPATELTVRFGSFAKRPTIPPFGSVDLPADPIALGAGPTMLHGWALDAFDLRRVRVEATDSTGRSVVLGDTHGTWMRPDVAQVHPDSYDIFNSGWSFSLDPQKIKSLAPPVTVHVYGESGDGRRAEIGHRAIR